MKIFLFLILFIFSGCSIVGPGQRAIITHFGSIQDQALESGIYLWIPFVRGITKFDLRVQKSIIETTGSSKDLQDIHTAIAVNWRIQPDGLHHFYKDVGGWESDAVSKVLIPAVSEVLKASLAKKTAEEIVSRRVELKKDIDENINERVKRYSILVDDVSIVDVRFSNEFIAAIERKQIAEQDAQRATYIAQKAIKEAEAEVNMAIGQAKAQALMKTTLTPEVLKKMAIEKWDGKFPQVMGQSALPFLDIKLRN